MRIRWLLSMYASLTLRTFALPYGRHRLPLTVSQRSLCNILSSLNGARYAVQSPRKDYPRMCFTRSGQRPAPGVGNVPREWEGCAEKKGANGRGREGHTVKRGPPDIASPSSRSLPPPMNALLLVLGATQKSLHSRGYASLHSLQHPMCVRYIRSPLHYSIIVHSAYTLPPGWSKRRDMRLRTLRGNYSLLKSERDANLRGGMSL